MPILVEYTCRECSATHESWQPRPAPPEGRCPLCAGSAYRRFGGALRRSAGRPAPVPATGRSFHLDNRDVPGICHMSGTEARRWVAMARGDTAGEKREVEFQKRAVDAGRIDPAAPRPHDHAPRPAPATTADTRP